VTKKLSVFVRFSCAASTVPLAGAKLSEAAYGTAIALETGSRPAATVRALLKVDAAHRVGLRAEGVPVTVLKTDPTW
jgi:hypothetical protein